MENWTLVAESLSPTATSYSTGTFTVGTEYAIVHRDLAYNYSAPAYVVITSSCTAPTFSTQPADGQSECINGTTTLGTVVADQTPTYQWYSVGTKTNTGGTAVSSGTGGTTATYTPPSTTAGTYYYYCLATNGSCTTASNAVQITVNPTTAISGHPATGSQTKYVGEAFTPLTITATGTGTLNYQWYSSTDASTSTSENDNTVGTNSNSFTPSSASAGTLYYYCVVSGDCGNTVSNISGSIITNNTVPTIALTSGSNSTSVNVNNSITPAVYTYAYVADAANVFFNWYTDNTYTTTTSAPSGLSLTQDTGAKTVTLSGTPTNGVYGTYYYKLNVNETNGNSITGTVTVNVPAPTVTLSSAAGTNTQTIRAGSPITSITYTVTNATGASIGTLPTGLSGTYNNGIFTISGTIDNAATLATTNFTVTAIPYTGYSGSTVSSSGSIIVKSPTAKNLLYITTGSPVSSLDTRIYPYLNNSLNYIVTVKQAVASAPASATYDPYDVIIWNEVTPSSNAEGIALKNINKPILNFKSFVYGTTASPKWGWATAPDAGKTNNGTVTIKQPTHPIFNGMGVGATLDILSSAATKGIQPTDVTLSGSICVATAPLNASPYNPAVAIHDVPASVRAANTSQAITSKYLMISICNDSYDKMTDAALTLINNAIDYLTIGTQFIPVPLHFRSNASGNWKDALTTPTWFSSADNINWSGAADYPTSLNASDVSILDGHEVTVLENNSSPSIIIKQGGKLTITDTKSLSINGNLNIESDGINNNGTLVDKKVTSGGLTLSGTATVNQAMTYRTWYTSSPVAAGAPTGMDRIKSYYEYDNSWPLLSGNMLPGTGYLAVPASTGITGKVYSGALNNGDILVKLTTSPITNTASSGFNLVGNPYPSYLDWTKVAADATNASHLTTSTMWYRTKVGSTYTFWTVNGSGVGSPVTATNLIPPMQAFWVQGAGELTFKNSMRSHNTTASPILMKAPAANTSDNQLIRLQVSNGTNTDEAVLYFNANAANGFDTYDSPKKSNENAEIPELYSVVDNKQLVINGMNSIPLDKEIPMGFVPGNATSLSIQATELTNIPSDVKVLLLDKVSGSSLDLTTGTAQVLPDLSSATNQYSIVFRSAGVVSAMESIGNNANALVYRNANNQITVKLLGAINSSNSVTVYNALGQKLLSQPITSTVTVINSRLTSGVYFVKTTVIGKDSIQKIALN